MAADRNRQLRDDARQRAAADRSLPARDDRTAAMADGRLWTHRARRADPARAGGRVRNRQRRRSEFHRRGEDPESDAAETKSAGPAMTWTQRYPSFGSGREPRLAAATVREVGAGALARGSSRARTRLRLSRRRGRRKPSKASLRPLRQSG